MFYILYVFLMSINFYTQLYLKKGQIIFCKVIKIIELKYKDEEIIRISVI